MKILIIILCMALISCSTPLEHPVCGVHADGPDEPWHWCVMNEGQP